MNRSRGGVITISISESIAGWNNIAVDAGLKYKTQVYLQGLGATPVACKVDNFCGRILDGRCANIVIDFIRYPQFALGICILYDTPSITRRIV